MLPAQGIRCPPDTDAVSAKIVPEIVAVHSPVHKGDGIENHMIVQVFPIQVGGDDNLIAAPQQTVGKFNAYGVGLLRGGLTWGKGLDDVVALHMVLTGLFPTPLGIQHISMGALQLAVDGAFKTGALRLVPIQRITDRVGQRRL